MKFYYKSQLVRTSKTHTYHWAILEEREDGGLKGLRLPGRTGRGRRRAVAGHPQRPPLCDGGSAGHRAAACGIDL